MAVINMSSIIPKINAYTESSQGRRQINTVIQGIVFGIKSKSMKHSPEEVAAKFVDTMLNSARSTQGAGARGGVLGLGALQAVEGFSAGTPVATAKNGMSVIQIPFTFNGNLHRESLYPKGYSGIDNIVALLNNGYAAKDTVYGQWKGNSIVSLQQRSGSGFIQNAVRQFLDRYASEYNIIDIEISGEYE